MQTIAEKRRRWFPSCLSANDLPLKSGGGMRQGMANIDDAPRAERREASRAQQR